MTPQLTEFFDFLRFPSVSTDSKHSGDVRNCAEFLIRKFNSFGMLTELHETSRHPIVIARNAPKPDRPTVLIYGHYDVQPVDPVDEWETSPFEPTLKGDKIFCR
ncbi:MAG: peptidase M20, partial [Verrucomicrobiota bacterium]